MHGHIGRAFVLVSPNLTDDWRAICGERESVYHDVESLRCDDKFRPAGSTEIHQYPSLNLMIMAGICVILIKTHIIYIYIYDPQKNAFIML